jgi:hypothetical protein
MSRLLRIKMHLHVGGRHLRRPDKEIDETGRCPIESKGVRRRYGIAVVEHVDREHATAAVEPRSTIGPESGLLAQGRQQAFGNRDLNRLSPGTFSPPVPRTSIVEALTTWTASRTPTRWWISSVSMTYDLDQGA